MTELVRPGSCPGCGTGLAAHIDAQRGRPAASATATRRARCRRASGGTGHDATTVAGPPVGLRGPGDVVGIDQRRGAAPRPRAGSRRCRAELLRARRAGLRRTCRGGSPRPPASDRTGCSPGSRWSSSRTATACAGGAGRRRPPGAARDDDAARAAGPRQCWAWAHVQADDELADGVAGRAAPSRPAFRCPAAVPAPADAGPLVDRLRRADLRGRPAGRARRRPESDARAGLGTGEHRRCELPVYHSWRFRTGPRGDFESLVTAARAARAAGGRRAPGPRPQRPRRGPAPACPASSSATRARCSRRRGEPPPWAADHRAPAEGRAADRLNASSPARSSPATYAALAHDPVVGPPAYAAAQAGGATVPAEDGRPVWFEELNTEPPHRAVAGARRRGRAPRPGGADGRGLGARRAVARRSTPPSAAPAWPGRSAPGGRPARQR